MTKAKAQQGANAHLIAAAPELLEALIRVEAEISRWRLSGHPNLEGFTRAQEQARDIIAKATA